MARKAIYKHATLATTPDDGTSEIGTDEWNESPDAQGMLGFSPQTSTITISSGNLVVTDTICVAAAESGTSDTIDTFDIANTSQYDLLYIFADAGDTITITHTGSPSVNGQIKTVSGINETLSETTPKIFIRKGNYWYGYGGGAVNSIDDVQDVTITSVADNEVLAYDSSTSKWINQTSAEAGLSTASATETLTNKSIDLANNTITGTTSQFNTALSDGSFSTLAGTESLTNKTISADSNTLSGIAASSFVVSDASGNIDGSASQKAIPSGVVVGTSDAQTLTNKTLTSPIISTISNTGTITLPSSTDTLVGRDTTDILTNKTLTSPTLGASYLDVDIMTAPSNPSTGTGRVYAKTIDSDNEGLFIKIKKNGGIVEVQIA